MALKTANEVLTEDRIKKEEQLSRDNLINKKLIDRFEKWFNDTITVDGYNGKIFDEFYAKQDLLIPILEEAGWEANFYTDKEWSYLTYKDEYQYTVYKIQIKRKMNI